MPTMNYSRRLGMLKPEYREYPSLKHLILEVLRDSGGMTLDAISDELAREELSTDNFTQFHCSLTSVKLMVRDSIYRSIMHEKSVNDFLFDGDLIKARLISPDGRGGKRDNAGRKSGWATKPETKLIRVPAAIASQLMEIAKKLDRGEDVLPTFNILDILPTFPQTAPEPVQPAPEPVQPAPEPAPEPVQPAPEPVQPAPEPAPEPVQPAPVLLPKKIDPFSSFFTEDLVRKYYGKKKINV